MSKKLFFHDVLTENSFCHFCFSDIPLNHQHSLFISIVFEICIVPNISNMWKMKDNLELSPRAKYHVFIICCLFHFCFTQYLLLSECSHNNVVQLSLKMDLSSLYNDPIY